MKFFVSLFLVAFALEAAPVTALRFSPDGNHLLISRPRVIEVRALQADAKPRKIPCAFDKVMAFAFSADGKTLAVAGGTPGEIGGVHLLAWPSGQMRGKWDVFEDVATCVAFGSSGKLAAGSADHSVVIFDLRREGRVVMRFEGHTKATRGLAFAPDGKSLVSVSADRTVKLWDAVTSKLEHSFGNHPRPVHAVAFRPGARPAFCVTASDDNTVRVWQPSIGRMVRIVRGHSGPVFAVAFSAEGRRIFSVGKEGVGRIIDADSDKVLHEWKAHDDWVYALAVGAGGKLATGDWGGEVRVWRMKGDRIFRMD
ncbi:MAG: WD40 repeat domain-containing protein [Verrucomicrobia subdivision 3 bacterium]|nr:WD40 repeat domain-containing protein [Limisphaerales bacterium]